MALSLFLLTNITQLLDFFIRIPKNCYVLIKVEVFTQFFDLWPKFKYVEYICYIAFVSDIIQTCYIRFIVVFLKKKQLLQYLLKIEVIQCTIKC